MIWLIIIITLCLMGRFFYLCGYSDGREDYIRDLNKAFSGHNRRRGER